MYSKDTEMVDLEASLLQCVNPHEVNPLPGADKGTEYLINFNVTNVEITESGEIYDPLTKVKLEMEEFKDLSVFLPTGQPTTSSETCDELNTPVFNKDAFDFPVMPMKSTPYDHKQIFNPYNTQQNKDLMNRQLQQESPISNISNIQQNNDISYINPPSGSSNGNVYYSDCESPPYELSHSSFQNYLNINTPEDSNSSNNSVEATTRLYLNVNLNNPLTETTTINTPDVINAVSELDNFNILDIVQAEELKTVDVDDIFSPYVKPEIISDDTTRSRRRRKLSYDSDDEYIPPTKTARKTEVSSDSDSDYEQHRTKRGRTRKAPTEGVTKYREIRDKNNEASRKSRQKRKQKEQQLEKECDELNDRNIKLKAQVEELEKTVSSYRENLFKIMLRK